MNLFSITSLLVSSFCFIQAIFIFRAANNTVQRVWGIFNTAVALWAAGLFWVGLSKSPSQAFMAWKATYLAGLCVTISFYHLAYRFCNLRERRKLLAINTLAIILAAVVLSKYFIFEIKILFNNIFYNVATPAYTFFILMVLVVVLLSFYEIAKFSRITSGVRKIQAMYFIYGFGMGWAGGISTFLPSWGILIYPTWHFSICLYILLMTYAIFKYQIMDIKILITRLGIFLLVYSLVLGIPFGLEAWCKQWLIETLGNIGGWIPILVLLGFATSGPFIFIYFQRRAESILLKKEHAFQSKLSGFSRDIVRVQSFDELYSFIEKCYTAEEPSYMDYISLYLLDAEKNAYTLRIKSGIEKKEIIVEDIPKDTELINLLVERASSNNKHSSRNGYLLIDELKNSLQGRNQDTEKLQSAEAQMYRINAHVVFPIWNEKEKQLLGFMVLGDRRSGWQYSDDDFFGFATLTRQIVFGISNIEFLEERRKEEADLAERKKNKDIGEMANMIGHQIKNRLYAIQTGVEGVILDSQFIKDRESAQISAERWPELLKSILCALKSAVDNSKMAKDIIDAFSRFSKPASKDSYKPMSLTDALNNDAITMINIRYNKMLKSYPDVLSLEFSKNLPLMKGNATELQQLFVNLINNALDAVQDRIDKKVNTGKGYKPQVQVKFSPGKDKISIKAVIKDNGIGIERKNVDKLFVPYYTSKATSQKGIGFGLYICMMIIERHGGAIKVESEYGKGTEFFIDFPAIKDKEEDKKNA